MRPVSLDERECVLVDGEAQGHEGAGGDEAEAGAVEGKGGLVSMLSEEKDGIGNGR
jgi:hypothetical protein